MGNEGSSQNSNGASYASEQTQYQSQYPNNQAQQQQQQQQQNPNQQNTVETLKTNVGAALHKGWVIGKAATSTAIDHSKRLANRTKNIPELLLLANEELQNHIQIRHDTNIKFDSKSKYFDSFRNPCGIVYVTGWSVGLGTFGGSYRRGFMMKRFDNGEWSLPFAIQEFEGSAGLQLKATIDNMWYVIKNKEEMKAFTDGNNVKLGAGAQLALGNAGLTTQADVTMSKDSVTKNEAIEEKGSTNASVGSAKGFAIGASIHGGTFQGYKKANRKFYCKDVKKLEILNATLTSKDAFDLIAGHPNMPDVKKQNLQIIQQFAQSLNQLIMIENQREGVV